MNYKIKAYPLFERNLKRLAKKYISVKEDYKTLLNDLRTNPELGTDLGNGLRKIRMKISSKNKCKSGGARIISLTAIISGTDKEIGLHYIYDKSEKETVTDAELKEILRRNGL